MSRDLKAIKQPNTLDLHQACLKQKLSNLKRRHQKMILLLLFFAIS